MRMPAWDNPILRNIAMTYGTRLVSLIIGIIGSVIIARYLGVDGRGFYAVAVSLLTLGVQFTQFGLHTANTYHVARDNKRLAGILGNALFVAFILTSGLAIIAWTVLRSFPELAPLDIQLLTLVAIAIPLNVGYLFCRELLVAVEDFRTYNLLEIFGQVFGLSYLGLLVLSAWISPETVLGAQIATAMIGTIWSLIALRSHLQTTIHVSLQRLFSDMRYGLKAYVANLLDALFNHLDVLLIMAVLGPKAAGVYAIALGLRNMIYMLPATVANVIFPRLCAETSVMKRWQLTQNSSRGVLAGLSVTGLILILVGEPAITLLYGQSFMDANAMLLLLLPGLLLLSLDNVQRKLLNSHKDKGYRKQLVYGMAMAVAIKLVALILWLESLGVLIIGVVNLISYGGLFFYVLRQNRIELHEDLLAENTANHVSTGAG